MLRYGERLAVHGALVLGHSLRTHCYQKHRVLLVERTVDGRSLVEALKHDREPRCVDHLDVHDRRSQDCEVRLSSVFKKFRAFQQTYFDKIVVMDLETAVLL